MRHDNVETICRATLENHHQSLVLPPTDSAA